MRLKSKVEMQREREAKQRAGYIVIHKEKPPAIYARQSAKDQPIRNKEAKAMQTDDLLDLAEEYEWNRYDALIFVENYYDKYGDYDPHGKPHHASGRLRIDQRPGLQHVIYLIETDQISAVICREISRLFRDETQVLAPAFAEACRVHQVVVITPHHVYDFNAEGRGDRDRFIEEAKVAAAYLKNMREIAHAAKHRKGAHGKYSGHAVPTGFMLTEDRQSYEPNPYWAPVVHALTRRYRQLDADLAVLRREIFGTCLFPDLPPEIAARVGKVYLEKVAGGYTIKSRAGLINILINPANAGHFHFDGQIVKRDAHPAIVDLDDYLFALYHLGDVDLDGNPIERPERAIRVPHKGTVARDGLLTGVRSNGKPVLTTDQGYVYFYQSAYDSDASYVIKDGAAATLSQYTGGIHAQALDTIFEQRLLQRLDSLFALVQYSQRMQGRAQAPVIYEDEAYAAVARDLDQMHREQEDNAAQVIDHFHAVRQEVTRSLAGVERSIAELKRQIAVLKGDLERDRVQSFMDPIDREDVYNALKNVRANLAALERKQEEAARMTAAIEDTNRKMLMARDYWPTMTLEKKKLFTRLVAHDILLHDTGVGFLEMTVTWNALMGSPQSETAYILQQNGSASNWTDEEIAILREMYPYGTRNDIVSALPRRSWRSIIIKASRLGIERSTRRRDAVDIPTIMSQDAYQYMQEHGLTVPDGEVPQEQEGVWWCGVSTLRQDSRGSRLRARRI